MLSNWNPIGTTARPCGALGTLLSRSGRVLGAAVVRCTVVARDTCTMRLVSWNVAGYRNGAEAPRLTRQADALAGERPDVVALHGGMDDLRTGARALCS